MGDARLLDTVRATANFFDDGDDENDDHFLEFHKAIDRAMLDVSRCFRIGRSAVNGMALALARTRKRERRRARQARKRRRGWA